MSLLETVKNNPESALKQQLAEAKAVMLGVDGESQYMRPMAPLQRDGDDLVWFFTNKSSETFQSLDKAKPASLCLVNEGDHFWASVKGQLQAHTDPNIVDELWSPMVEAWFEGGKSDPDLMLLAFSPETAEISCSTGSKLKFGWEIIKANVKEQETPDIGVQRRVRMAAPA